MALAYGHNAEERLTLDRIAALRRANLSWGVIADRLNKAGSRTRGGKEWTRVSVYERWRGEVRRATAGTILIDPNHDTR